MVLWPYSELGLALLSWDEVCTELGCTILQYDLYLYKKRADTDPDTKERLPWEVRGKD